MLSETHSSFDAKTRCAHRSNVVLQLSQSPQILESFVVRLTIHLDQIPPDGGHTRQTAQLFAIQMGEDVHEHMQALAFETQFTYKVDMPLARFGPTSSPLLQLGPLFNVIVAKDVHKTGVHDR